MVAANAVFAAEHRRGKPGPDHGAVYLHPAAAGVGVQFPGAGTQRMTGAKQGTGPRQCSYPLEVVYFHTITARDTGQKDDETLYAAGGGLFARSAGQDWQRMEPGFGMQHEVFIAQAVQFGNFHLPSPYLICIGGQRQ